MLIAYVDFGNAGPKPGSTTGVQIGARVRYLQDGVVAVYEAEDTIAFDPIAPASFDADLAAEIATLITRTAGTLGTPDHVLVSGLTLA